MPFATMARGGLHRPIVPLVVEASTGQRLIVDALVDTGADLTLLPIDVAQALGIDLTPYIQTAVSSALGQQLTYAAIDLILELRSIPDVYRWRARVGILSQAMTFSILGTRGFFEHFRLHYDWSARAIEIEAIGPLPL
jgi:hypothetical protein